MNTNGVIASRGMYKVALDSHSFARSANQHDALDSINLQLVKGCIKHFIRLWRVLWHSKDEFSDEFEEIIYKKFQNIFFIQHWKLMWSSGNDAFIKLIIYVIIKYY